MQRLATYGISEEELFGTDRSFGSLGRMLYALFNLPNIVAAASPSPPLLRDVWLGHEDMQLMAARDKNGSMEGLYVACWAAHNGQSHNHNDVGNFIIFVDGRPFIIDIGRPTYTRKNFSGSRYEIPEMQSAYHNLPTINGVMQQAGRQYAAKDVQYNLEENRARLRMDIAPAYPEKAGVKTWIREVALTRGEAVRVVDSFELERASGDIVQSLITPCEIARNRPGTLVLKDAGRQIELIIRYDSDKLAVQTEAITVEDGKLREVWGPRLHRILLKSRSAAKRGTWTLQFSK